MGVVKRRVLRGLWRRLVGVGIIGPGYPSGCPGLYTACIVGRVVPHFLLLQRGLRFAPSKHCIESLVVRPCLPRWGAHTML